MLLLVLIFLLFFLSLFFKKCWRYIHICQNGAGVAYVVSERLGTPGIDDRSFVRWLPFMLSLLILYKCRLSVK